MLFVRRDVCVVGKQMIVGCGGVYGGFAVRAGRERRERCDSDAERETFEELVEDHSYKKGCCMERKVSTLSRQRRRNIPNSDPDMIARVSPMTNEWIMMPSCRTCVYASAST